MAYTVQDVLDAAKKENIVLTYEQAEKMLNGEKVCGVFYCIGWDNTKGQIYIVPKPPKFVLKPKDEMIKSLQKMKEQKKNKVEKDKTLKRALSLYNDDFIEKLLNIDAETLEELNTFLWTLGESPLDGQEFKEVAKAELKARKEPTNISTPPKSGI